MSGCAGFRPPSPLPLPVSRPIPTWPRHCTTSISGTSPSRAGARPSSSTQKSARTYSNLGTVLVEKGLVDEAIANYQKAVELEPTSALVHTNLGTVLGDKGRLDEAIASHRKAIELVPKLAAAHSNLGENLTKKGQLDEAIAECEKAVELEPTSAGAHHNRGNALLRKGQFDEAMACFRKALDLDPTHFGAYSNMGAILCDIKRDYDGAITCFRKAIELDPSHERIADVHHNLGTALRNKNQLDEAIASFRKSIELNPKLAEAHVNLGFTLASLGRFGESLDSYRRAHELGSKRPDWNHPSAQWVRKAEAMAAMESKLPAFLKSEFQPGDNNERLVLAAVCHGKNLHQAATGLYAAAFAADPKLADDLNASHLYNAACFASMAAAGQGDPGAPGKLDDKERTRLRKRALDWLRADLALRARQLNTGKPADRTKVSEAMLNWQRDPDLSGLRDAAPLAKLPAEEQKAFTQFWADVAALLQKTTGPPSLDSLIQQLPEARKALANDSPQLAGLLAQIGLGLQQEKKWTEAEPLLRECLAIREQTQPDVWSTFNTKSMLGGGAPGPKEIRRRRTAAPGGLRGDEAAGEDNPGTRQGLPSRSRGTPGATLRGDR